MGKPDASEIILAYTRDYTCGYDGQKSSWLKMRGHTES